ncbi:TPA: hypothetical protein NHL35_002292 [Legionella pneumophila]|uniref:Uncharacterized protein n=1 Tax=Legionella pneumophila (strain Lens) TaxID=297245 RepID=Q5X0I8_LEGPL|nr:hypothetical protein [Legionella pneumophila]AOW53230.1 hypothetical protein BE841_12555 [Legionella pneumophila subsp. pneumophila]AOW55871.1 hypothetical protein BE842_11085 [Legionella pneumophila subsp. pneumophila]AOW64028.1 hypothetical protein BE845_08130 [Legionella pneumophila subsp. pneumophila]MCZ4686292.1 hypothetical protein [Legionella pneumophila]MDW9044857.1 hypothetical protein [Legionella pneumophila]
MKTEALLSWLNVESNESYDSIRIKYQLRLEALEKEERIKKMGGINPFAPKTPLNNTRIITSKEIQEAWAAIDSLSKYQQFKGLVAQEENLSTIPNKKMDSKREETKLTHFVRERAQGPRGRRLPSHLQAKIKRVPLDKPHSKLITEGGEQQINAILDKTTLSVSDLQSAVYTAVQNYTNYHMKSENKINPKYNRGQGDGFFSFFRHGSFGITAANNLYISISGKNATLDETIEKLKDFLGHSSRAYHHHSFTSYLADALAEKGLLTSHPASRYKQEDVVNQLDQWIAQNSTVNLLK